MRNLIAPQQAARSLPKSRSARRAWRIPGVLTAVTLALIALSPGTSARSEVPGVITEFALSYPNPSPSSHAHGGSTHEITFDPRGDGTFWVTAPEHDAVVHLTRDGKATSFQMPPGSAPHGIVFDAAGQLWVSLEDAGVVVRLDPSGKIVSRYDVRLACASCPEKINTHPHGLTVGADGKTLWFTGKATGTVGRITPDGQVRTFPLATVGSVPIYIEAGPDGNMWVTELVGNAIARVTPQGVVTEFPIPTPNSRPIALVPDPGGRALWLTEEAGNRVGRIDLGGKITEFAVPKTQNNVILAGLAFDRAQNLWVQQYVDENNPDPPGPDHLVRIDRAVLAAGTPSSPGAAFTFFEVPTRQTVMHRIIRGPQGELWFTELKADRVGRLIPPQTR
ncbi:virginiamycin B lyase family protein [Deinococcus planocerae]|uniref:Vgb family protein n=1 Tax=Deinococcus planocerae TaxID=1737569 RepID=UPI0011AEDC16|nr:hypothetical protein [Deinococcus planocerae]